MGVKLALRYATAGNDADPLPVVRESVPTGTPKLKLFDQVRRSCFL
jgi:hypothetical protein